MRRRVTRGDMRYLRRRERELGLEPWTREQYAQLRTPKEAAAAYAALSDSVRLPSERLTV